MTARRTIFALGTLAAAVAFSLGIVGAARAPVEQPRIGVEEQSARVAVPA